MRAKTQYKFSMILLFFLIFLQVSFAERCILDPESQLRRELCKGRNCLHFVLLKTLSTNETISDLRRYYPGKYISTKSNSSNITELMSSGYLILADYRAGINSAAQGFRMTLPILILVNRGQSGSENNSYVIHFFLPFTMQENPPSPQNNQTIQIVDYGFLKVYTYRFEEKYITQGLEEYHNSTAFLKARNVCFEENYYLIALYGPYHSPGRKISEIWNVAKECETISEDSSPEEM